MLLLSGKNRLKRVSSVPELRRAERRIVREIKSEDAGCERAFFHELPPGSLSSMNSLPLHFFYELPPASAGGQLTHRPALAKNSEAPFQLKHELPPASAGGQLTLTPALAKNFRRPFQLKLAQSSMVLPLKREAIHKHKELQRTRNAPH